MRSNVVIVARPGRSPHVEHTGGIAVRCTEADTVYLVSTAATPLGGDTLQFRIVVESGARLKVRTAAATVALPGTDTAESHASWTLDVDGVLDLDPQPTIVAGPSVHLVSTRVELARDAALRLRERVQIGRSGECAGFWSGSLSADIDGAPLLRHRVELGNGSVTRDEIASPRAYVSELRYPDTYTDTDAPVLMLAGGGCLATWQGERL